MDKNEAQKFYSTYIKSAQGTVALAVILNLIYIIRAAISKNLDFWFSLYVTEFTIKSSSFAPSYQGSLSKPLCIAIIILSTAALIVPTAFAMKKPVMFYPCLVLYGLDSLFMAWGFATDRFGDFTQSSIIDVVFHGFVLFFIIVGIISGKKMKTLGLEIIDLNRMKKD